MASTAGGARYLIVNGHIGGLLVAAGGGEGESSAPPDPLLGSTALRTLAKVLVKAAAAGLDVSWTMPDVKPRLAQRLPWFGYFADATGSAFDTLVCVMCLLVWGGRVVFIPVSGHFDVPTCAMR